jgi:hypothetical protein
MKLNLGCGHNRLDGFINVDASAECRPDKVWDLEQTPWPWPDSSVSEARFFHSLEHMGADPKVFLAIMKELYRVMRPGGVVHIVVPHPRHDNFLNDPTHVRPITPQILHLFDRTRNDEVKARGGSDTPLAHYTGVDFRVTHQLAILAAPYNKMLDEGTLSREEAAEAARSKLNVISEFRISLTTIKTGAAPGDDA